MIRNVVLRATAIIMAMGTDMAMAIIMAMGMAMADMVPMVSQNKKEANIAGVMD